MKIIAFLIGGSFLSLLGIYSFIKFEEGQLTQCNKLWAEKVANLHLQRILKRIGYKDYEYLTIKAEPQVISWEKDIENCIDYSEFKNQVILKGLTDLEDSFLDRALFEEKLAEFLEKSDSIDSHCQQSTGCNRIETVIPFFNKVVLCGF